MENPRDFGDVLILIGSKSKYQKILLYAIVVPICIIVPIMNLSSTFMLHIPNHWCHVPGLEKLSQEELSIWRNNSLPIEVGPDGSDRPSQCQVYQNNSSAIDCPRNVWDYDRHDLQETMPSEFNWVCSRAHYSTMIFTTMEIGSLVGTIIFGILADKVGRKPAFFASLSMYVIFRFVSLYIPGRFTALLIVTFLSSLGFYMMNQAPTTILAEICDDEYRSWAYSVLWFFYVVGMAAVPYISYFCSHWFYIGLATTMPGIMTFLFWFVLPESPRWLTSVGRTKEAAKILEKIALVNGTSDKLGRNELEEVLANISKSQPKEDISALTLFRKPVLARHMCLVIISWAFSNLIYEVITLNSPNMSGDKFLNYFILAIIEAPSSIVGGYLLQFLGRRWTAAAFFSLCSISCFVSVVFLETSFGKTAVICATLAAKFCININYLIVYLQTTELLPTPLRSTGNSLASIMSSALATTVPSIVYTSTYSVLIPYLIMGSLAALAAISSTFIPETMHQDLPETIEAANEFGKDIPYWRFRITQKARHNKNSSDSESKNKI